MTATLATIFGFVGLSMCNRSCCPFPFRNREGDPFGPEGR
jgi:hypothetical protein